MTCPRPEIKSVFVLIVSYLSVLLQLAGGEWERIYSVPGAFNIAIFGLISVWLIFVQLQVLHTETHRSDNLQIESMSVTSEYVDEKAW